MPQIFVMLSPHAQDRFGADMENRLEEIDSVVTSLVISHWPVPAEDVACSALNLSYTRNEADIQIELRYTAGQNEYESAQTFDPSIEQQIKLINEIQQAVGRLLEKDQMICSAWTKPYYTSKFIMQNT